jgi:hypothetical protein
MVRIYTVLAAFLTVTLALVLLQPSLDEPQTRSPDVTTRDTVNLLDTVESAPIDALVARALAESAQAPAFAAPVAAAPSNDLQTLTFATLGNLDRATGRKTLEGAEGSLLYHLVQRSVAATGLENDPYTARLRAEAALY